MLSSKGRIRLNISLESFLREAETRFIVLPINGRICVRALELPAAYPKIQPIVLLEPQPWSRTYLC
jgi:hypothetical protein